MRRIPIGQFRVDAEHLNSINYTVKLLIFKKQIHVSMQQERCKNTRIRYITNREGRDSEMIHHSQTTRVDVHLSTRPLVYSLQLQSDPPDRPLSTQTAAQQLSWQVNPATVISTPLGLSTRFLLSAPLLAAGFC